MLGVSGNTFKGLPSQTPGRIQKMVPPSGSVIYIIGVLES